MGKKKKKNKTDLGRKAAEAVIWSDSHVLHDFLRFCWPRNFLAEQPSLEKQQFNGGTAFWAFCRSVSSIWRHLTGWGRAAFICETFILPMKKCFQLRAEKKELQFLHICKTTCRAATFLAQSLAIYLWVARELVLQNLGSVVLLVFYTKFYNGPWLPSWLHRVLAIRLEFVKCCIGRISHACKAEGVSHKCFSCEWIRHPVMQKQQKKV